MGIQETTTQMTPVNEPEDDTRERQFQDRRPPTIIRSSEPIQRNKDTRHGYEFSNNPVVNGEMLMNKLPIEQISPAQVNFKDTKYGRTPLHWACRLPKWYDTTYIMDLINLGAEIDVLDNEEITPLMLAAESSHPDAMRILFKHGVESTKTRYINKKWVGYQR